MMSEKSKRPRPKKRTYVYRPNAVSVTVYSQDGSPVPRAILDEAADAVTDVAHRHNLLVGVADS